MRRLFSNGIALLILCHISHAAYAGSGYEAFPESAVGSPKIRNSPEEAAGTDGALFWRLPNGRESVPEDDAQSDSGEDDSDAGPSEGWISEDNMDPFKAADETGVHGASGDENRRGGFFRQLLPWGKDKAPVQTIPRKGRPDETMMPEAPRLNLTSPPMDTGDSRAERRPTSDAAYRLGVGDVLQVTVWKDETMSKVLPILPDGMINYPLIGRVEAAGKTIEELESELNEKISRYVPDPFVGISVQQAGSMVLFVIGKVNQPGRYPFQGNMTVLQALAMAGGLNVFAKKTEIKIIREKERETKIFRFNYDEVVRGENLDQNIRLRRGDIIVAP